MNPLMWLLLVLLLLVLLAAVARRVWVVWQVRKYGRLFANAQMPGQNRPSWSTPRHGGGGE